MKVFRKNIIILMVSMLVLLAGLPTACSGGSKIGNLEVRLQDANGSLLAGGKVVSNTQPEGQLKVTGLTNSEGKVIFNDIAAGEYEFYISRFDYLQKDFTVKVIAGKTTTLTFTLEKESGSP
jgi:hypothetical protein